jgi:putative transposase
LNYKLEEWGFTDSTGSPQSPTINSRIRTLYTRGLNSTEIQDHLRKAYQVHMGLPVLEAAADTILADYQSWQDSALECLYPIVYFDSLTVRFRVGKDTRNHTVLSALGIDRHGQRQPLGLWVTPNEGRQAWQLVLTELKQRGVNDIFIASLYLQRGAREALAKVFPQTQIQLCVVRLIDNALDYVAWKDRKEAARALRAVYTSGNAEQAAEAMMRFMCDWDDHYPAISQLWHTHWDFFIGLFTQPAPMREALYATNAIQSLNEALRKVARRHGAFADDKDLLVRLYLAQQHLARRWSQPLRHWKQALNCMAVQFGERLRF